MDIIKQQLQMLLDRGLTMKEIGYKFGVSRQRIYQLLDKYDLQTPERQRKGFWKGKSHKEQWVWKTLSNGKNIPKDVRWQLYEELCRGIPENCPVLGIPLDFSEKEQCLRTDSSPSIDKIIPSEGYVPGNVKIVSWRANRIKNDGTPEEHRKIADFYESS